MPLRRLLLLAALVCLLVPTAARAAGTPLYPDLVTLPPRDLHLDRTDVSVDGSGDFHNVLRFSNTVWNAGEGPLVMNAIFAMDTGAARTHMHGHLDNLRNDVITMIKAASRHSST